MGEGIGWEDTLPLFMEKVQKQSVARAKRDYKNIGDRIFKNASETW